MARVADCDGLGGGSVTITSVARMVIIVQASFGLVVSDDPRYNIGFVTSAIETNLAIITASAPALRTLARDWKPGGWLPGLTRRSGDVEMASAARGRDGTGTRGRDHSRSKLSRGNSRRARRLRNGRPPDKSAPFQDVRSGKAERELRSRSPRRSEEEAMTINGPMRVSDIQREIDGLVDEIGYGAGAGAAGGAGGRRFAERYYSESVVSGVFCPEPRPLRRAPLREGRREGDKSLTQAFPPYPVSGCRIRSREGPQRGAPVAVRRQTLRGRDAQEQQRMGQRRAAVLIRGAGDGNPRYSRYLGWGRGQQGRGQRGRGRWTVCQLSGHLRSTYGRGPHPRTSSRTYCTLNNVNVIRSQRTV